MTFAEFEQCCAQFLRETYSHTGCEFVVTGGTDPTTPDIVVTRNGRHICNIEVKMPIAQCSQFVVFTDHGAGRFVYSASNHPSEPSDASAAIVDALSRDFDRYKKPSSAELGLDKRLYYDRIIDYHANYKKSEFFMTRERKSSGNFIVFRTESFQDYFEVTACRRPKKSGSHNPNRKERSFLPELLSGNGYSGFEIYQEGKYTDMKTEDDHGNRFILGDGCRYQFKRIGDRIYRITGLSETDNATVIFSIRPKLPWRESDWPAFCRFLLQ